MRTLLAAAIVTLMFSGSAQAASRIRMQVTLANGASPQLVVMDGGMATIHLHEGRFGLQATVDPDNAETVRVMIYDVSGQAPAKIDDILVTVGGSAVSTRTTPPFDVGIVSVTEVQ
jgi:hypothetical protein